MVTIFTIFKNVSIKCYRSFMRSTFICHVNVLSDDLFLRKLINFCFSSNKVRIILKQYSLKLSVSDKFLHRLSQYKMS